MYFEPKNRGLSHATAPFRLSEGEYFFFYAKKAPPFGDASPGKYRARTYDLSHVKRMLSQLS